MILYIHINNVILFQGDVYFIKIVGHIDNVDEVRSNLKIEREKGTLLHL